MSTVFVLLGVAVIAYRVFVKGESIIVENPNWKMRGLACLVMGLAMVALSAYSLIVAHLHNIPIPKIVYAMLAVGVVIAIMSARTMRRSSP